MQRLANVIWLLHVLGATADDTRANVNADFFAFAPDRHSLLNPNGDRLGAVASESQICSEIGRNVLREYGNAADGMSGTGTRKKKDRTNEHERQPTSSQD